MISSLFSGMPMVKRFGINITIVLLMIFGLSGGLLTYQWFLYSKAHQVVSHFESFKAGLLAMEKVSIEREPTDAILGEDLPIPAVYTQALQHARQESDRRIAQLLDTLDPARCTACVSNTKAIQLILVELSAVREDIDQLARHPRTDRGDDQLQKAVEQMIDIIPRFLPVTLAQASNIAMVDDDVLNHLLLAQFSTLLRHRAGQLGSHFTSALAVRRSFTKEEQFLIERTWGRIEQLQIMIEVLSFSDPVNSAAFTKMNEKYFEDGLRYIDTVRTLERQATGAGISTAEFGKHYAPSMRSIIDFRDSALLLAEEKIQHNQFIALFSFISVGAILVFLFAMLFWMVAKFRHYVLTPFVQATRVIHALARGDLTTTVPATSRLAEIQGMFDAIRVLKINNVKRVQLESERARLMDELQVMAETDPLTHLLNRRAFEHRMRVMCQNGDATRPQIALVIFDVDHFKKINDTYGHAVGDEALQIIAKLCQENWRQTDIVARIGGEEFAAMMRVNAVSDAQLLADRMRQRIADAVVPTGSGGQCTMTASFGLAVTTNVETADMEHLFKRADRMLYKAKSTGRNRVVIDSLIPMVG